MYVTIFVTTKSLTVYSLNVGSCRIIKTTKIPLQIYIIIELLKLKINENYIFLLRFWAAPDQFEQIDYSIRKFLFLFACTNSCANPLIYGLFADKKASIFNSRERLCFLPNGRRRKWRNVSDLK